MRLFRSIPLITLFAFAALAQKDAPKAKNIKPGFNLFSKDQDVQMGREYASQVEQQMAVIKDEQINAFVRNIGERLAKSSLADKYPYTFKVVQEKSINAFALPGGPTFTHTGLITAADTEAQIAGVLAHEISHVALRHGTNQASKANLMQLPAVLGGAMLGNGGITGTLAQLGIGLGANSLIMKFSRNAESDADLLGVRIMSEAGYNPIGMAQFFEKLQAESGKSSRVQEFFASHPNPDNRVKKVQAEILLLPARQYQNDTADITRVKALIQGMPELPKPKPQPGQGQGQPQGGQGGQQGGVQPGGNPSNPSAARPSRGLREFQSRAVSFGYPDNWQVMGDQNAQEVMIASPSGIFANGAIGYGVIAGLHQSRNRPNLQNDTAELLRAFQQRDQGLRPGASKAFRLPSGSNAIATRLQGQSPFQNTNEAAVLVSVEHPAGLFYMLLIAPESDLGNAQPAFDQMIDSIRIPR